VYKYNFMMSHYDVHKPMILIFSVLSLWLLHTTMVSFHDLVFNKFKLYMQQVH